MYVASIDAGVHTLVKLMVERAKESSEKKFSQQKSVACGTGLPVPNNKPSTASDRMQPKNFSRFFTNPLAANKSLAL